MTEKIEQVLHNRYHAKKNVLCLDPSYLLQVRLHEGLVALFVKFLLHHLVCRCKTTYLEQKIQNGDLQRVHDYVVQLSHDHVHRLLLWQHGSILDWWIIPSIYLTSRVCQHFYDRNQGCWELQEKEASWQTQGSICSQNARVQREEETTCYEDQGWSTKDRRTMEAQKIRQSIPSRQDEG